MINRKRFLKLSALGAAASLFSHNLWACSPDQLDETDADKIPLAGDYDAIIVGSGYGGAVSALRLAEAGKKVLLIEMGLDWKPSGYKFSKMAWAKETSTWLRNTTIAPFGNYRIIKKFTGALDRLDYDHAKVYLGRGIGGGSLVNGGMAVTPKKDYFKEVFPELDADAFYSRYFPLANQELGVSVIPDDFYNTNDYYEFSRVGEREAQRAGFETVKVPNIYDYQYMQRETTGEATPSALDGEVIYGNNHGKRDLTKTYLKKALATGNVEVLSLHKVNLITDNQDGTYTLDLTEINVRGKHVASKQLITDKLFLAAGSMGTTELLLKSKLQGTLPEVNNEVGKYWGNNGNCMSGRSHIKGGTGKNQSTIPAAAIDNWDDTKHTFFTEIAPLPLGLETNSGLYLTINKVPKLGSLGIDESSQQLTLDWGEENTSEMVHNAQYFLDTMNKANGGKAAHLIFKNGIAPDICYHPLGGCVLGKATDNYGRLQNTKGIYVVDGALIPGTIGVNPFVTIAALAEYCIENIMAHDFK